METTRSKQSKVILKEEIRCFPESGVEPGVVLGIGVVALYTSYRGSGSVLKPVGQPYVASLLNLLNSTWLLDTSGHPL